LKEFENMLGKKDDTRSMRREMKEEIAEVNDIIKKTLDLFRQFDELPLRKKEDQEHRNKVIRRTKEVFDKEYAKFTKTLKEIQTKEKVYLEARKSITKNPGANNNYKDSVYSQNSEDDHQNAELSGQIEELD